MLARHPRAYQQMLRVRRVNQYIVDHQIVALSYPRQPLPRPASVTRLIDPPIRRAQIKMRRVLRVSRKRARIPAVRPKRKPRSRAGLKTHKAKEANNR